MRPLLPACQSEELWRFGRKRKVRKIKKLINQAGWSKGWAQTWMSACNGCLRRIPRGVPSGMVKLWRQLGFYSADTLLLLLDKWLDISSVDLKNLWCGYYTNFKPGDKLHYKQEELEALESAGLDK